MKNRSAYLMFISSMLIFSTIGIFRRFIPLSSAVLACTRGAMGGLFLLIFTRIRGISLKVNSGKREKIMMPVIGAAIGINWILLFESYRFTSVAVSTLCYYMQPTIVILLSPIFFRERLTLKKGICAAAALIGMVLVSGIADGNGIGVSDLKGIAFGLGAAAFYSSVVIMNKKNPVDNAYGKTMIQLFAAAAVLVPYLLFTDQSTGTALNMTAVIMVIVVGIVHTGIAYALYFGSMNDLHSQTVAVLSYIDPVGALILSALILNEPMSAAGIAGAVLIIGSAAIAELPVEALLHRRH